MKIEFLTPFSRFGRYHEVNITGGEIFEDLVRELTKKLGEEFKNTLMDGENIRDGIMVLANGINILSMGGLKHKVKDSDEYVFCSMIIGG